MYSSLTSAWDRVSTQYILVFIVILCLSDSSNHSLHGTFWQWKLKKNLWIYNWFCLKHFREFIWLSIIRWSVPMSWAPCQVWEIRWTPCMTTELGSIALQVKEMMNIEQSRVISCSVNKLLLNSKIFEICISVEKPSC